MNPLIAAARLFREPGTPIRTRAGTWPKLLVCGTGALGLALTVTSLWAHHGVSVKFDPSQRVTLQGRVTRLDWANPHVHIFMVVEEDGRLVPRYVELESPVVLEGNGWDRESLQPGDEITVEGFRSRDGSPQVWADSVVLASTGRAVLDAPAGPGPGAPSGRSTPRWPDGQPRLGPPPGETGYWVPASTVLMQDGVDVEMDANGLLRNIADAPRVAPFQPWSLALYEFRQQRFLRDDPMFLECKPPSGPRKFQDPYGVQFLEDRTFQRIFFLAGGGNRNWHFIYTDGRPHEEADVGDRLYYGRAVAQWEDDTLVIESDGFNESFWFSNGGLPHTDQLRLTERISRPDLDTLTYEVTIEDPGAYVRPWSAQWNLRWVAGEELPQHFCQDNRP